MRCPKCQYIGFDNGDRCRNCGYEFSLTVESGALDLPIQTGGEPLGPMSDFALDELVSEADLAASPGPPRPPAQPVAPAAPGRAPITSSLDLPLFKGPIDDQRPLVSAPAVPRAPLAVRRSGPAPARAVARRLEEPELDLGFPGFAHPERAVARAAVEASTPLAPHDIDTGAPGTVAGVGARIGAALIDLILLAGINLSVLYFTLRLTGLTPAELRVLPPVPLFGFLLLLTGAYFVAFTAAGGQTIGKMAAGIRVVPAGAAAGGRDRVPLGHAVVRAAAYFVSLLPAGLGLLPALFGPERRAVHDRLADTRVVKA